jgi:glycine cleavage system regulatory protein
MKTFLVLTLIGEDKPGLVESLAQIVSDNHGNWLESDMSRLAGQFAGILRISVEEASVDSLVSALEALTPKMQLVVVRSSHQEEEGGTSKRRGVKLSLVANDRPGIIRDISRILSQLHVNVDDLETACREAPMASGTLFHAKALLHLPESQSIDDLREALEQLADDLIVELNSDSD